MSHNMLFCTHSPFLANCCPNRGKLPPSGPVKQEKDLAAEHKRYFKARADRERKRKARDAIANIAMLEFADPEPPLKVRKKAKFSCKFLDLEAVEADEELDQVDE